MSLQEPRLLTNVFFTNDYLRLKSSVGDVTKFEFQKDFSRYVANEKHIPELTPFFDALVPVARSVFGSDSLMPTYVMFSHYEGPNASLFKHKDDNACTYTIDFCLYQRTPWDLYVEDKPYTLYPNQALAYYGNDQMHWREDFPDPENNHVAMIFFHFAEPDHWWFKEGPDHVNVLRSQVK